MTDLIVGQSGGPTAVINASLAGVIEEARAQAGVDRILGMRRGVEGLLRLDVVDLSDLDPSRLEMLALTPGAALGSCRHKLGEGEAEQILERLRKLEVGLLCYIGGNDSADTTNRLSEAASAQGMDLQAIAIPKTIDNDLPHTDHCPGYPSAARFVAAATAASTLDTRSLPTNYPIKIIEVMGRDAGWLAASAGLSKRDEFDGPHLIYVPERPFSAEAFLDAVRDIHTRVGYCVVVVAETIRDADGRSIAQEVASVDMFGHPIVRGAGDALVRLVESKLELPARVDKPGSLQRSSRLLLSPVDVEEAREAGREAVRLAVSGRTGLMVTIERAPGEPYSSRMSSVPIDLIANQQRLLPAEFLDSSGRGITDAFRRYAMPLLGPEPFPEFARL